MFVLGKVYRRRDLHAEFGGQEQGGISTPSGHNLIFLFTGESGKKYGYSDRWTNDGIFLYTGERQVGDMEFVRGNRAIRDHAEGGKDLHLFAQTPDKRFVRYEGQMVSTGFQYRQAPDKEGNQRRAIVFELTPLSEFNQEAARFADEESAEQQLDKESLEELRRKALATSTTAGNARERKVVYRVRSLAIKLYVLRRANGNCEGCGGGAPFRTSKGKPYLEPHHIRRLSDGGPDHPRWVVAVCPNCHRRAHYSHDRVAYNQQLSETAGRLEEGES